MELHQIPAYMGIASNKLADTMAKEAIGQKLKKTRRGGTRKLDTNSTKVQTPLVRELVLAKATVLERKLAAKQKEK